LLKEFGMTPREWGTLRPTQQRYLEQASLAYLDDHGYGDSGAF
jgi:hypothetical protein